MRAPLSTNCQLLEPTRNATTDSRPTAPLCLLLCLLCQGLDASKSLEAAIAAGIFPKSSEKCVVGCDWQCYLDRHPDLVKAFGKTNVAAAQSHYWSDGKKEGRPCTCKDANSTLIELSGGNDNSAKNLKRCVGECDADGQCAAGLRCFQRSGFKSVPGCKGNGTSSWDYCYKPDDGTSASYTYASSKESGMGCTHARS